MSFAARGATVVLHARVVHKLEQLYDEIVAGRSSAAEHPSARSRRGHGGGLRQRCERHSRAARPARTRCSPRPLLGSLGPIEHQSFDAWQKVIRVNLVAAMALTRSTLPCCRLHADACVIFTLDTRASDPRAYWGAYAASKAGSLRLRRRSPTSARATTMCDQRRGSGADSHTATDVDASGRGSRLCCRRRTRWRRFTCISWARNRRLTAVSASTRAHGSRVSRRHSRSLPAQRPLRRTAVTQHDAKAPEFVGRQRVGQNSIVRAGRHQRSPSARQTSVVNIAPT
jgi:hypothetical protein